MGAAFLHQRFPENLFVTSLNAMLAVTLVLSHNCNVCDNTYYECVKIL